jgi:hypothetical protein
MESIRCLECGMQVPADVRRCPKCDNHLDRQTDGTTVTVDIAHHGEQVREALHKLEANVKETKRGVAQSLRLIVGAGAIRDAVLARMMEYERRKVILRYQIEDDNAGAIMVTLK